MNIAVVVPVYKVEPYLKRCVDSILSQTHKEFVLVLIDDGSPDKCGEICDYYAAGDSRIKVIHQENGGLSAARNTGIEWLLKNSTAEYITFVDSDDWLNPDCLEEFASGVSKGADCVCLGHADVSDDGIEYCQYRDAGWNIVSPAQYLASDDYFLRVSAWGKLYKLKWFDEIRYPIGKLMEDAFTTYRLLFRADRVAMREKACYNYYTCSSSIIRSEWNPRKLDAADAYEEARVFFENKNEPELANWALRMKCTVWALALKPLSDIDPAKAVFFRQQIDEIRALGKLPFWKSRMLYKCIGVRFYRLRWCVGMLLDFFMRGRRSWLVRESLPIVCVTIRRLYYKYLR